MSQSHQHVFMMGQVIALAQRGNNDVLGAQAVFGGAAKPQKARGYKKQ